ncbi:hypothetical protein CJJ23_03910 [Mycoplasmopsis agassizii]|uniref:ROK family protein n=1 Tax=Mycoplasmopsis agassizii TaxID=33922 RepID=A0A269TJI1_9BACT|nr:ROK family protein [Mycoplasmopsis agassizii]PAK21048.1 hypothetical protein CJJ23_03910 [Mycoplasmopsis agassizii]
MKHVLAFDIGGTHIKYGVINEKLEFKVKNFIVTKIETIIEDLLDIALSILKQYPEIKDIAISSTGIVDSKTKKIINANGDFKNYIGTDFKVIEENLNVNLILLNDANAAAYAEVENSDERFAMITFGTGVGAGIVFNKTLQVSKNGFDGEFGYLIHNHKMVNDSLSFSKFNELSKQKFNFDSNSTNEFKNSYLTNHEFKTFVDNYLDEIASFLFNIIVTLNLDKIYIGGGINHISHEAKQALINKYNALKNKTFFKADIVFSNHGNSAALIGLAKQILHSKKS